MDIDLKLINRLRGVVGIVLKGKFLWQGQNLLLIEFGIHGRLESCAYLSNNWWFPVLTASKALSAGSPTKLAVLSRPFRFDIISISGSLSSFEDDCPS